MSSILRYCCCCCCLRRCKDESKKPLLDNGYSPEHPSYVSSNSEEIYQASSSTFTSNKKEDKLKLLDNDQLNGQNQIDDESHFKKEELRLKAEEEGLFLAEDIDAEIKSLEKRLSLLKTKKMEEEARLQAQDEARVKAEEAQIKEKMEEEARIKAQDEARVKAEEAQIKEKKAEEARLKAQDEARVKAEEAQIKENKAEEDDEKAIEEARVMIEENFSRFKGEKEKMARIKEKEESRDKDDEAQIKKKKAEEVRLKAQETLKKEKTENNNVMKENNKDLQGKEKSSQESDNLKKIEEKRKLAEEAKAKAETARQKLELAKKKADLARQEVENHIKKDKQSSNHSKSKSENISTNISEIEQTSQIRIKAEEEVKRLRELVEKKRKDSASSMQSSKTNITIDNEKTVKEPMEITSTDQHTSKSTNTKSNISTPTKNRITKDDIKTPISRSQSLSLSSSSQRIVRSLSTPIDSTRLIETYELPLPESISSLKNLYSSDPYILHGVLSGRRLKYLINQIEVIPYEEKYESLSSIKNPQKIGFLRKRGTRMTNRSWKERFCLLKDGVLYWAKNQTSNTAKGSLSLGKGIKSFKRLDKITIQIDTPQKEYIFQLMPDEPPALMEGWWKAIVVGHKYMLLKDHPSMGLKIQGMSLVESLSRLLTEIHGAEEYSYDSLVEGTTFETAQNKMRKVWLSKDHTHLCFGDVDSKVHSSQLDVLDIVDVYAVNNCAIIKFIVSEGKQARMELKFADKYVVIKWSSMLRFVCFNQKSQGIYISDAEI